MTASRHSPPQPDRHPAESHPERAMSAQHPSRRHKGCALCNPNKWRGQGRSHRDPVAVQRRLGLSRRYSRRDVGTA